MGEKGGNDCFACWNLSPLYFGHRQLHKGIGSMLANLFVQFFYTLCSTDYLKAFIYGMMMKLKTEMGICQSYSSFFAY